MRLKLSCTPSKGPVIGTEMTNLGTKVSVPIAKRTFKVGRATKTFTSAGNLAIVKKLVIAALPLEKVTALAV